MKKIPDYDGYYADSDGTIWCDLGKGNRDRAKRTDLYQVKPRPGKNGYRRVYLRERSSGKRRDVYVHRIIASLFCENPEALKEVNHKDSDRGNNAAENLEWVTHRANLAHARTRGHMGRDALGRFTYV